VQWSEDFDMLNTEEIKKNVGRKAADFVQDHSIIGLGTGSTVIWLIKELGLRVNQGLQIKAVATSNATRKLAGDLGITILPLNEVDNISLTIDGADEIDPQFNLIKGGGGALLQEKMVAAASDQVLIIADETKYVSQLGRFPLPVEVVPSGWKQVRKKIQQLGCQRAELRLTRNLPFVTDNGHFILDCHFETIADPAALNISLHLVPGVVETGLFINMTRTALIGKSDGHIEEINKV